MPAATLLLREPATSSLSSIVEKSQQRKPPLPEYDLRLNACQLDFVLLSEPARPTKPPPADEGFESDVDTLSIVSSDDSFTSGNLRDGGSKIQETDSANGSASSDSDTEAPPSEAPPQKSAAESESHHLVDCMCYTDIKFPNILVFVVKGDALVFRFDDLDSLRTFYTSFSTFKAIANQKAYGGSIGTKFNLLQRTDKNGITHIEITKEPETRLALPRECEHSDIISLNTPEAGSVFYGSRTAGADGSPLPPFNIHKESRANSKDANSRQRSESAALYETQSRKECAKNSHNSKVGAGACSQRSASSENILDLQTLPRAADEAKQNGLNQKVWNSAEDLLDAASPKRPERRRKPKARAPQPPTLAQDGKAKQDVLRGQYVRVNVASLDVKLAAKDNLTRLQNFTQKMLPSPKPGKDSLFQQFRYVEPKRAEPAPSRPLPESSWTYSVPRFLRKPRSHSETRNFTPMAYRYIDTTSQNKNFYYGIKADVSANNSSNVSNRLFGMSSKLKDFSSVSGTLGKKYDNWDGRTDVRRGSLGELTYKINSTGGSLKSVIKKDDNKRRNNEKKVTFSAYTTVQVV